MMTDKLKHLSMRINGQPVAVRFCEQPSLGLREMVMDILTGALGDRICQEENADRGEWNNEIPRLVNAAK